MKTLDSTTKNLDGTLSNEQEETLANIDAVLAAAGHRAWLVGESLQLVWRGERPAQLDVATDATLENILSLFRTAVPSPPLRCMASLATAAGPTDFICLGRGAEVEPLLMRSRLTIHAVALQLSTRGVVDPIGGARDIDDRRLRGVHRPSDEDDRVAAVIDTVHQVARHGDTVDDEWKGTLCARRDEWDGGGGQLNAILAATLRASLLMDHVAPALELLRCTGIESDWMSETAVDSGKVVATLPPDETLRLAGWLRGTHPARALARLRVDASTSRKITRWLAHHPIDADGLQPTKHGVAGLCRRLDESDLDALFALRSAELATSSKAGTPNCESQSRVDDLRQACTEWAEAQARSRARGKLAISGNDVMRILGCEPGPDVGGALRQLESWCEVDPSRNDADSLEAYLRELKSKSEE